MFLNLQVVLPELITDVFYGLIVTSDDIYSFLLLMPL